MQISFRCSLSRIPLEQHGEPQRDRRPPDEDGVVHDVAEELRKRSAREYVEDPGWMVTKGR